MTACPWMAYKFQDWLLKLPRLVEFELLTAPQQVPSYSKVREELRLLSKSKNLYTLLTRRTLQRNRSKLRRMWQQLFRVQPGHLSSWIKSSTCRSGKRDIRKTLGYYLTPEWMDLGSSYTTMTLTKYPRFTTYSWTRWTTELLPKGTIMLPIQTPLTTQVRLITILQLAHRSQWDPSTTIL